MALHQQPILGGGGGDVGENDLLITHAFEFFIEHIINGVVRAKKWEDKIAGKVFSKTRASISDIAFALLAIENMWDKWEADEVLEENESMDTQAIRYEGGWKLKTVLASINDC